jgi:hypothetical protein
MNWDYEPLSEEEAQKERYQLMDDGVYRAVIEHCEGRMSSSNNPMGVFNLRVWDSSGKPKEITDYIPFIKSMMWKLRHLCDSAGLVKEFEEKKFRPELAVGKEVLVSIKTQAGKEIPYEKLKGKPPGSKYSDKNVIDDYVMTMNGAVKSELSKDAYDEFKDSEIPF